MNRARFLSIIFGILVSFGVCHAHEALKVSTSPWSPYAMKKEAGQFEGLSVDVVDAIFKRLNLSYEMSLYPANRLNLLIGKEFIDINFADSPAWYSSKDKEKFLFSDAYAQVNEYVYFRKDKYLEIEKPGQLASHRVGITDGYYYEAFNKVFATGEVSKHAASSNEILLRLLINDRVDAAFFDDKLFEYLLVKEQVDSSWFRRGKLLSEAPLCLKLHKKHGALVKKINQALNGMKDDGTLASIIKKYTHPGKP